MKLFGACAAIRGVENIPTLGVAAATYNSEHVANPYLYFGSAVSVPVLIVCLAALFFSTGGLIVDLVCGSPAHTDQVQSGINPAA